MTQQQFCSSCGTKLESAGGQFCPQCGTKVLSAKLEETAVMKCTQCQADMPVKAVKCPKCGSWVKEINNLLLVFRSAYLISLTFAVIWFIWVKQNAPFRSVAEIFTSSPGLLYWIIIIIAMVISVCYDYKLYKRTGVWFWF